MMSRTIYRVQVSVEKHTHVVEHARSPTSILWALVVFDAWTWRPGDQRLLLPRGCASARVADLDTGEVDDVNADVSKDLGVFVRVAKADGLSD